MECRQANNLTDVESLEHRLEMATVTVEKILLDPGEVLVSLDLKIAELKELLNAIPDVEIRSKWEARYLAIQEKRNDINNVQPKEADEKTIKYNIFKTAYHEMKNCLQAEAVKNTNLCIQWDQIDQSLGTIMTVSNELEQFALDEDTKSFLNTSVEHIWLLYFQLQEREKMENQSKTLTCSSDHQQQQQNESKIDDNNKDSMTAPTNTFSETIGPSIKSEPDDSPSIDQLTTDLQDYVTLIELLLTLHPLDVNLIESNISSLNTAIEMIPQTKVELVRDYTEKTVTLMGRFISLQVEG